MTSVVTIDPIRGHPSLTVHLQIDTEWNEVPLREVWQIRNNPFSKKCSATGTIPNETLEKPMTPTDYVKDSFEYGTWEIYCEKNPRPNTEDEYWYNERQTYGDALGDVFANDLWTRCEEEVKKHIPDTESSRPSSAATPSDNDTQVPLETKEGEGNPEV